MSSGLFSIANSALLTHQRVMQVISQNIANADTPGYSRQEALLQATTPLRQSYGSVGTGVSITTILRKRDVLLDDGFRSSSALASGTEMHRDMLRQVEGVFGEPSDAGMANALDQFWSAFSDLATSPNNGASQAVVQQRGRQLVRLFNDYDTQLTQQRSATIERVSGTIDQINGLAEQIAELNGHIVESEVGGDTANDLRDQRDLKLDQLSRIAGTRVIVQANGTTSVLIGNSTLVDGNTARPVSLHLAPVQPPPAVTPADIDVSIRLGTSPDALFPLGGELGAQVTVLNTDIPGIRGRLDALASSLMTTVNAEHRQGFLFSGATIPGTAAGNFFDPGTLTQPVRAGTFALDTAISVDATKIAYSRDIMAPTDNGTATAIASLRNSATSVSYTAPNGSPESGSFLSFLRRTVTTLGQEISNATDSATVYRALSDQGEARRQSVSGVNTDEELSQMLKVQQAYVAATKLIKTMDEMMQTLLQLI